MINDSVISSRRAAGPGRLLLQTPTFLLLLFLLVHIPLALLLRRAPALATIHALGALGVGLHYTFSGRQLVQVVYVAVYLAGAEVLWRMANAQVPWEFAKYAIVGLFFLALARRNQLRGPLLPLLYALLLIPSIMLTLLEGEEDIRSLISFNLSGPLLLAIGAWFFSNVRLDLAQWRTAFLALLGPVIGIAAVAFYTILTTPNLQFTDESNNAASGGYGPNQVSAILGLGALFAFFLLMDKSLNARLRWVMFGIMVWLGSQSAFTFSRGGLYNAGFAVLLAVLFLLRERRSRLQLLVVAVLVFALANYFVLPTFESFTAGAFGTRFSDTTLSGRDQIALADLNLWLANPVFGVGPGRADLLRVDSRLAESAHTEYSRLLSEHGVFGLVALLLLITMAIRNFFNARTAWEQALTAALIGWSAIYMTGAAMRLAAPALLLSLAFASCQAEQPLEDATAPPQQAFGRVGAPLGRRL
ncbi:MAG: O-antigen ligase family protein [Chloroflexota bacterium]|nr:O-antigen ligase family protein [Chloroflexota bacterium]